MDITAAQPTSPQNTPELMYLCASTAFNGTTYGSPISIAPGYAGLVVLSKQAYDGNKNLDVVGPGNYVIDGQYFPQLAQKLRLQPGQMPATPPEISVFLINTNDVMLTWSAYMTISRTAALGLSFCAIDGRFSVKIMNPASFYGAFRAGWAATLNRLSAASAAQLQSTSPGRQAEAYVVGLVKASAGYAVTNMKLVPEQVAGSAEPMRQAMGAASAAALQAAGIQCTAFEISNTPEALRAPCGDCGSTTAPTAYATYNRTISLLYVRFGAKREGNFCVPCAAKISASYNCVMLVCGWWGYIGIILTPIYIVMNCYHFLRTAFGPKIAVVSATAPQQAAGSWPPSPDVDWGQEVKEDQLRR